MTAPPWGHKPLPVDDVMRYWGEKPPEQSARCAYWIERWEQGTWRPNRRVRREGYHGAAELLGVYVWEYWNVMRPLMAEDEQRSR
jgi:hypothetical protein